MSDSPSTTALPPGAWTAFLEQHRASAFPSTAADAPGFNSSNAPPQAEAAFFAALPDLGLIAATGDDAKHFLHNQLTNDVEHLDASQARLAGYCSPKGRLLATFVMWQSAEAVMLQLPRDTQAAVQKRLQMFVLRAKVKLTDVTDSHAVLGISGAAGGAVLAQWFPLLPAGPWSVAQGDAGVLIRMADVQGVPRWQWITSPERAMQAWPQLAAALPLRDAAAWRLQDIHAGVPHVVQATQEQFVPQMINFEILGGVNFRKGCYPGQEIVARSQYLGKLKRRMFVAAVDADAAMASLQPAAEVFSSEDPDQPAGQIVNIEPAGAGTWHCLISLKTAAAESGTLHLGAANGPALRLLPLPYLLGDAS